MRKPRLLDTVEPNASRRRRVGVSGNRVSAHGVSEHGVSRLAVEASRSDARIGAGLTSTVVIGATRQLARNAAARMGGGTATGRPENGTPAGAMHRAPDWHARLSSKGGAALMLAIVSDDELYSLLSVPQAGSRVVLLLDARSS